MKKLTFLLLLLSVSAVISCKNDKENTDNSINSCNQNPETFSRKGITLNITLEQWYLTRMGKGGSVSVKINGSTNGDSATIRTIGDGLIDDVKINLDAQKNFSLDIGISFNVSGVPTGDFNENTMICVYKNADTIKTELESCTLRY